MIYITSSYRLPLKGLYWIWRRTQNLVGWAGLLIAVFTLYQQTAGKEHNLNIIASSIDPGGDEITFGMIYQNTGNYTEVITDADAFLRDNKSPTVSWGNTLEECFEPIVLKPGETIHKYYTVKLPYYGFEKTSGKNGNLESDLILSHSVLMPNAGSERFTLNIGEAKHRAVEGTFSDLRIKKNILKVEFEDARIGASSQSIPNRSNSTACAKKRRNVVN